MEKLLQSFDGSVEETRKALDYFREVALLLPERLLAVTAYAASQDGQNH
jgi:hypothetical protein